MKKIIIIALVIISSAAVTFALTRKEEKKVVNTIKIEKADFAVKSGYTQSSMVASAD